MSIEVTADRPGAVRQPGIRGALTRMLGTFNSLSLVEQAAILTLPLLLLYVQDEWFVRVPVVALAILGLIFSEVRHNGYFWFALTCLMAAGIVFSWEVSDNHKYAICYWTLAIFLVHWFDEAGDRLVLSARLLLGLIFAFALFWKLVTPDFMTGDFFQHAFLYDGRFSAKVELIGILDSDAATFNQVARETLTTPEGDATRVQIRMPPAITELAQFLAWWTIVLEGLVAMCFLAPARFRWTRTGDYLLMIFVASTYLVAPVIGFGWLLIIMGIVQCRSDRARTRLAYVGVLLLLQFFRIPRADVTESIR